MTKTVPLGHRLRYPITVRKLLRRAGDEIKKRQVLFQYTYTTTKESGDIVRDAVITKHTAYAEWESPVDGHLKHWRIREGAVLSRDQPAFEIDEQCGHEVQFGGLCAICGKDLTEMDFSQERADTERATISMIHDQNSLKVSADLAQQEEKRMQERLLQQRKLVLVVDLDQTIIHACIDPTVGEWYNDASNPNHESLRDIGCFQLDDATSSKNLSGCWYYIKKRPGLDGFLQRMSQLFEMHVYTMGTRPYAISVANVVDPDKKLFSNRVISRDEAGSVQKELQRLFPHSTDMVVIIDDRSDVWPNDRENLIRVVPFDFFKGIGDINSSFLPARTDILPGASRADASSSLASFPTASSSPTTATMPTAAAEQEKELTKQIQDRPLAHMQEDLEKEESKHDAIPDATQPNMDLDTTTNSTNTTTPETKVDLGAAAVAAVAAVAAAPTDSVDSMAAPHSEARQHVLRDDDTELVYIERHLTAVHEKFYKAYDGQVLRNSAFGDKSSLDSVPDVGQLLKTEKSQVLRGTSIVLSGLVHMNVNVHQTELGMQLQSFGALVHTKISDKVTHLVINPARTRTQKLRQACRIPRIQIVSPDWLTACFSRWEHVDEYPYLIDVNPADRASQNDVDVPAATSTEGDIAMVDPSAPEGDAEEENDVSAASSEDEAEGGEAGSAVEEEEKQALDDLKGFDWGAADDELEDFLNSDDDEDDENGEGNAQEDGEDHDNDDTRMNERTKTCDGNRTSESIAPPLSPLSLKRKVAEEDAENGSSSHGAWPDDAAPSDASQLPSTPAVEHPMFKRLRLGAPRKSSTLRNVTSSDGRHLGVTNEGDSPASGRSGSVDPAASITTQDLEDDLDAALAAELEAGLADEMGR
ncbi:CTD phosphatase Fcp1 [Ceratocystis pirilliformis]|uniref:RNA polymerase II subunit A C-terminal domain phosphatase n=1 Tax=Ceratocystis pirilliformis TaxID=259994 RepID=A0ABR3ZMQ5_9PEZI